MSPWMNCMQNNVDLHMISVFWEVEDIKLWRIDPYKLNIKYNKLY